MKYDSIFEDYTDKRRIMDSRDELILSIEKVKQALENAYKNFDFITEPELVDSCIYEVKAMQLKYGFLIQKAKELGIVAKDIEYNCSKEW